jgi:hypothetical protein
MVKDTNYDESDDYTEDEGASFPEEEEEDLKGLNLPRRSYEPIATEPFIEDPWPKTVFILMLIGSSSLLLSCGLHGTTTSYSLMD